MFSMSYVLRPLSAALCAVLMFTPFGLANDAKELPPELAARIAEKAEEPSKGDLPPFDKVMKDMIKVRPKDGEKGFMTLWVPKDKKVATKLYAEIGKDMLNKEFLMANSIAAGPFFAGWQWNHSIYYWERNDKKIMLVQPELRYTELKDSTLAEVVERTYTDKIVCAVSIKTESPEGNPIVDLADVFMTDVAGMARLFGGKIDRSLSKWATPKIFPKNVEIAVEAVIGSGPEPGGTRATLHYSLSELPQTAYKPREADSRIGYFLTAVKDWSKKHDDRTLFKRLISRWHLEKLDPSLEMSPVKNPIIYYVEKTVPVEYRRYVHAGILEWNEAFETCGFLNAMQTRQQTETEFNDLAPEDVRYNFFRWIVSGWAFARGPSRVNPRTGQILDADIIMDDSMVRAWTRRYDVFGAKGPAAYSDPLLEEFLEAHPDWQFASVEKTLFPDAFQKRMESIDWGPEIKKALSASGHPFCECAKGMAHQIALTTAALDAADLAHLKDKYVGQLIKQVVMHEVGHTLGLRHNFKASAWKPLSEILAIKDGSPTVGSVMDYNPGIINLDPERQGDFITRTIGPYDVWAIQYGYMVPKEGQTESDMLKEITSRVAEAELAYATDEDVSALAPDPRVNMFDMGSDPMDYADYTMKLVEKLRDNIEGWAVKDGESYNELRKAFDMLLFEYGRVCRFVARNVGGAYIARDHKGDPDARPAFELVPADTQRKSLQFLAEHLFGEDAFDFDPELLNKLAPGRWAHWGSDAFDWNLDYPIHDRIAATQYWALFLCMNPVVISRIHDAQLKVRDDEDLLTLPELLNMLTESIFSEVQRDVPRKEYSNRKPFISSIRRNLQRMYLKKLIKGLLQEPGGSMPADAHSLFAMILGNLSQEIGKVLENGQGSKLDDYSRAHLQECKTRIDKAMDADFSLNGNRGYRGGVIIILGQEEEQTGHPQ